jgi:ubiquinol-cytochrome c reductase cytochrome c1 subunit
MQTMIARTLRPALAALGVLLAPLPALAAGEEAHVTDFAFSFEGPFGAFDQSQLQRGLQVYATICSTSHGLRFVAFRNLSDDGGPALSEAAMRAFASGFEVFDATIDDFRPATPPDHFPPSQLAGAPDLSLMAKARAGFHGPAGLGLNQMLRGMGGPEYIASILTGFTGHDEEVAGVILHENTAFGGYMAMGPVFFGDDVTYADGTQATPEQMAQDVAAFLMWAAEPKMMARKQAGLTAVLFLVVLTVLLYFTHKKLWSPYKGKHGGRHA